jgi:hypothetical protein
MLSDTAFSKVVSPSDVLSRASSLLLSAFPLTPFEGEKFSLGIRMRELRDADDVTKLLLLIDDAPPDLMSQTYLIERYTHSVLEGLLIVALVIGAADISFIATADTRPCGGPRTQPGTAIAFGKSSDQSRGLPGSCRQQRACSPPAAITWPGRAHFDPI